jgi:hypothetical protein
MIVKNDFYQFINFRFILWLNTSMPGFRYVSQETKDVNN